MATSNVKLTADTSQAQSAMGALKTSWINAAAGMAVVEKAFNAVASAASTVNQAIRDQGQFFSAVKDESALAAVQIGMSVTDGMIKPMAIAKAQNVLMRGDLKLTQDEFNAVAKAAVELGRATGEDVNTVFDRLSKSVLKGSTEAVSEYGISVKNTGTIQEKQKAILGELVSRYGGLTIAVGDAAEAQDKAANQSQLQMLQTAKQLDGLSQTLTKFKDFYKNEFLAGGIDALFGTTLARGNQIERLFENLGKQARSLELDSVAQATKTLQAQQNLELGIMLHKQEEIAERAKQYTQARDKELATLRRSVEIDKQRLSMANELGLEMNDIFATRVRMEASEKRIAELNQVITAEMGRAKAIGNDLAALYEGRLKSGVENVMRAMKMMGVGFEGADERKAREARKAAEAKAAEERKASGAAKWKASRQQTRDYIKQKEEEAAADFERELAAFGKHQDDMEALKKRKADEAITAEQLEYVAEMNRKLEQDRRLDEARAEIIEANARRESEIKKKALEEDLNNRREYVAKTKELVEGLAQVSLNAIFAEKKARDGLSRTEYMMKQLAAYMKGEALKYAAKSIGYAAEGVAAMFWNPPASAAAFKASALSAAAATAFGGASVAASAMAGKSSSSSGASSASSTAPDREAMSGATTPQRSEVTVILGGRGVVIGDQDALARSIGEVLGSAKRRGVIRA